MTDIRTGGVARESLVAATGQALLSGVAREALLWSPTAVMFAGLAREVLLLSPPPVVVTVYQTAVSISTG